MDSQLTGGAELLSPSEALSRSKPRARTDMRARHVESRQVRYGFRVRKLGFLIADGTASEVMTPPPIYTVPNTRAWLCGLANLRGNLVPVYDLAVLLQLNDDDRAPGKRMLLVLGKGERMAGVLIDGTPASLDINKAHRLSARPALPGNINNHISAAYTHDDILWMALDHQAFFEGQRDEIA